MNKVVQFFQKISKKCTDFSGSTTACLLSIVLTIVWIIYAIPKKFDNDSQMILNTATSIITFIMLFFIQNSQNRESRAMNLKMDEMIRSHGDANNKFMQAERLSDEKIKELSEHLEKEKKSS